MKLPKLHYFDRSEFIREEDWFTRMSPRLLVLLDTFRHLTGPCIISPHPKAVGRRIGEHMDNHKSQHNYEYWGEVRAVDVFPHIEKGPPPFDNEFLDNTKNWLYDAEFIGFTGIGLYTDWTYKGEQRPGLHLDVRESAKPGEPDTWGRIGEQYVSLDKAMEELA